MPLTISENPCTASGQCPVDRWARDRAMIERLEGVHARPYRGASGSSTGGIRSGATAFPDKVLYHKSLSHGTSAIPARSYASNGNLISDTWRTHALNCVAVADPQPEELLSAGSRSNASTTISRNCLGRLPPCTRFTRK